MKKFSNLETQLMAKHYGSAIEHFFDEQPKDTKTETIAALSEYMYNQLVENELKFLSEGYISDIINQTFDNIQFDELYEHFKK